LQKSQGRRPFLFCAFPIFFRVAQVAQSGSARALAVTLGRGRNCRASGVALYCWRQWGRAPPLPMQVRCAFQQNARSLALDIPPSETSRWRAVSRVLRSPLDLLSCTLLPSDCSLCGSPLPRLSLVPICDACWADFPPMAGSACVRCSDSVDRLSASNTDGLCRACRLAPPSFSRAVAYGLYEGRLKAAIHALKYDRLHPAAQRLGRMLAQAIAQLAGEAPAELLVVPVPLHGSKYAERGFNQARALAKHALDALAVSHPQWRLTLAASTLMRQRATESQSGLSPRQRRLNVRGAFVVADPAKVAGKHILLIDDILTTGATARAASLALRRAGASSVWVASLARAHRAFPPGSSFIDEDLYVRDSGIAPSSVSQAASMHSSVNQPSS
jgi:ComF family protein